MTVAPLSGNSWPGAAGPPAEAAGQVDRATASGLAPATKPGATPEGPHAADLRRLEALAAQSGLRVQVETLPQSNLTVIHLVDSPTGYVVGEFPPEGVAQAVAELEAQAMARSAPSGLDHQA